MTDQAVDILAFGAHPDDVELGCGGTLLVHQGKGKKTAIVDLTYGELGTRGTVELRKEEAASAATILGVTARENLGFSDGFFANDKEHQLEVVKMIRKYRPSIVLVNALHDRHPDHGRAAALVTEASFLAGLEKVETELMKEAQQAFRPRALYHYMQFIERVPDITVDISDCYEKKMEAVLAHRSQFYDPNSKESKTLISSKGFLQMIEARALASGMQIGVKYGEGFIASRSLGTNNLFGLI